MIMPITRLAHNFLLIKYSSIFIMYLGMRSDNLMLGEMYKVKTLIGEILQSV